MKIINHPSIVYASPISFVEEIGGNSEYTMRRDVLQLVLVMGSTQPKWLLALEYLHIKDGNIVHSNFVMPSSFADEIEAKKAFCQQLVRFRSNMPPFEKVQE